MGQGHSLQSDDNFQTAISRNFLLEAICCQKGMSRYDSLVETRNQHGLIIQRLCTIYGDTIMHYELSTVEFDKKVRTGDDSKFSNELSECLAVSSLSL